MHKHCSLELCVCLFPLLELMGRLLLLLLQNIFRLLQYFFLSARLLSVKLSENAVFDADAVFESYFCTGASDEVILLDANADGKADILCNHGRSRIEILHSK